jgi:hypothetical protein
MNMSRAWGLPSPGTALRRVSHKGQFRQWRTVSQRCSRVPGTRGAAGALPEPGVLRGADFSGCGGTKEAELEKLQSTLIARSAELQEKEKQLSERWDAGRIYAIPISEITANPHQPRREFDDISLFSLANSIREHGILQPLTVRRIQSEFTSQETDVPQKETESPYQLIAGERRLRAAIAIGMETVPCIILDADNRRAAELAHLTIHKLSFRYA